MNNYEDKPGSVDDIPDISKLLDSILSMISFIDTEEMLKLEKKNPEMYRQKVEDNYSELSLNHYGVFCLLLDRENRKENLEKLVGMINMLRIVKEGKMNLDDAHSTFMEDLNEKYVYNKFGGKHKFEQAMKKQK